MATKIEQYFYREIKYALYRTVPKSYNYIITKSDCLYYDPAFDLTPLVIAELTKRPPLLIEQNMRFLKAEIDKMMNDYFSGKIGIKE